mgnify:CR=1 FL=1
MVTVKDLAQASGLQPRKLRQMLRHTFGSRKAPWQWEPGSPELEKVWALVKAQPPNPTITPQNPAPRKPQMAVPPGPLPGGRECPYCRRPMTYVGYEEGPSFSGWVYTCPVCGIHLTSLR